MARTTMTILISYLVMVHVMPIQSYSWIPEHCSFTDGTRVVLYDEWEKFPERTHVILASLTYDYGGCIISESEEWWYRMGDGMTRDMREIHRVEKTGSYGYLTLSGSRKRPAFVWANAMHNLTPRFTSFEAQLRGMTEDQQKLSALSRKQKLQMRIDEVQKRILECVETTNCGEVKFDPVLYEYFNGLPGVSWSFGPMWSKTW